MEQEDTASTDSIPGDALVIPKHQTLTRVDRISAGLLTGVTELLAIQFSNGGYLPAKSERRLNDRAGVIVVYRAQARSYIRSWNEGKTSLIRHKENHEGESQGKP
ncbi:hypothetical protein PM082_021964 [Marasmius tenuissimus]|nr:hypothetical protein PM082_021964 [Marasmius tenuissimus]